MSKSKNSTPATTAEVRAWAVANEKTIADAGLSVTFLNPPSGKVRGRVPTAVYGLFTEATGRPSSEKSPAEGKTIALTLTKRDKAGRSRGKVTLDVPVAEVRTLGGAPAKGRISSAVREAATQALAQQRGW